MDENLYAEYPEAYDALYAQKDYDAEVEFVASQFEDHRDADAGSEENDEPASDDTASDRKRALVVGCGTGEHSKRLRQHGFEVVGVDKYEAMVERARTKSDAEFRVGTLPDLVVDGEFDLVWLPFTVVQHLDADDVAQSLRVAADHLAADGLLVFDQILTGEEGLGPRLWTYPSDQGTYARLTHVHEVGDDEYRWDSLVFTPDGEFFVDTHRLYDHDSEYLAGVCDVLGLSLDRYDWYDSDAELDADADGSHPVFVASSTS